MGQETLQVHGLSGETTRCRINIIDGPRSGGKESKLFIGTLIVVGLDGKTGYASSYSASSCRTKADVKKETHYSQQPETRYSDFLIMDQRQKLPLSPEGRAEIYPVQPARLGFCRRATPNTEYKRDQSKEPCWHQQVLPACLAVAFSFVCPRAGAKARHLRRPQLPPCLGAACGA